VSKDLRAELKQKKPFGSLREEAALSIMRTAAEIEHGGETVLKPCGITATQYNVLRILRGAEPAGLCRAEISDRLIRRVPDVTRLLDRLEDMHLIERSRGGDDRRYVTTRITREGLKLLDDLQPTVEGLHRAQLGHMSDAQLKSLIELLGAVRDPG
jgi:DNA-binding MarR family transcriptional regulator